ncbi:hypothetical protein F5883DRAFT_196400 [Diaporthe sp. PMI_573]|nr:hypothetical protein F5883DRAFT_196400 [Diaporthaceae sp. PMI_573]
MTCATTFSGLISIITFKAATPIQPKRFSSGLSLPVRPPYVPIVYSAIGIGRPLTLAYCKIRWPAFLLRVLRVSGQHFLRYLVPLRAVPAAPIAAEHWSLCVKGCPLFVEMLALLGFSRCCCAKLLRAGVLDASSFERRRGSSLVPIAKHRVASDDGMSLIYVAHLPMPQDEECY